MGTFGKLKINLEMNQEKIEELADTVGENLNFQQIKRMINKIL